MPKEIFLETVINSISHPFYIVDIKDYSVRAANMPGYSAELIKNLKCYQLAYKCKMHCSGKDNICPLVEMKKTKKPMVVEHIHYNKNRKSRNIEMHAFPMFDSKGNMEQIIEYCLDVTEQRIAENALKKIKQNLEIKIEEKTKELEKAHKKLMETARLANLGKMASAVAHELRNPMGVIRLAVYSLKKKIGDRDLNLIKHLNNIDKKITESDQIIHDLLAFSRASELEFKSNHLNESVEKGLESVEQRAKEFKVKIIKKLDPKMPKIIADFGQLREVFYNLFLNAIQAMKEAKIKELRVTTRHQKKFAEIEINDTGCGISKENFKKVGEPFFSTKTKGIGLGLYIANEIIKRHKGKIEIKSKNGEGTIFIINLPINLHEGKI